MLALFSWDGTAANWQEITLADDGFASLCTKFTRPGCDYCIGVPHTVLDRERLLTLTAGKMRKIKEWHEVRNMDSFTTEHDERSKRLTFTHEQANASKDFRQEHLSRYVTLQMDILQIASNFPETIHDLRGDWRLQPPRADDFRFNLVCAGGQQKQGAIAIYVGVAPPETVKQLKDELIRAWGRVETRRLVIWYSYENIFQNEHTPLPLVTDDQEPPASIIGPAA